MDFTENRREPGLSKLEQQMLYRQQLDMQIKARNQLQQDEAHQHQANAFASYQRGENPIQTKAERDFQQRENERMMDQAAIQQAQQSLEDERIKNEYKRASHVQQQRAAYEHHQEMLRYQQAQKEAEKERDRQLVQQQIEQMAQRENSYQNFMQKRLERATSHPAQLPEDLGQIKRDQLQDAYYQKHRMEVENYRAEKEQERQEYKRKLYEYNEGLKQQMEEKQIIQRQREENEKQQLSHQLMYEQLAMEQEKQNESNFRRQKQNEYRQMLLDQINSRQMPKEDETPKEYQQSNALRDPSENFNTSLNQHNIARQRSRLAQAGNIVLG